MHDFLRPPQEFLLAATGESVCVVRAPFSDTAIGMHAPWARRFVSQLLQQLHIAGAKKEIRQLEAVCLRDPHACV